ncbi:hypothetical protein [Streptomyces sp. NPDC057675]|uniref:hypothetical protein n=1 Tax=Streptomyces sp. NPDC057675 TaxID=3346204 RepID=UPI0036C9F2F7
MSGYIKRNGTEVRQYWRAPAGTSKQTALAFVIVAAVFVFGGSPMSTGSGTGTERAPAPRSSVVTYPIKWPSSGRAAPRPAPTVSYPIKWPGWKETAPRPAPAVSYPIKWDRSGGGR